MDKGKGGLAIMIGMGGKKGMEESGEEVMFKAPEGMDVSEMKKGDEKEFLAKVKYYGNGQFELISIDGYPIASKEEEMPEGYEEGEEEEGMEEEESFPKQLQSRAGLA